MSRLDDTTESPIVADETTISEFRIDPAVHRVDLIGRTVSHYRILEKLGEGGMGEVYLAEDQRLGRHVAIKVLPPRIARQAVSLERFAREASAIGALNHPNIVTIHAVEDVDGLRLIVMERVEGRTLASMLPSDGLEPDAFLELAIPLTEALAAAHARGIIHRDLKPANVMVTDEGRVKVVDFGLAKLGRTDAEPLSGPARATLTQAGHLVGTITYMSPEQLRGEQADLRSDVFALGTLLYEMATGRHPFDGDTQPVVISSILCQEPAQVSAVREHFPGKLDAVISRCLCKDPAQRYADAGALHRALLELKTEHDIERLIGDSQAAAKTKPNRFRALGVLGVLGVVVLVVLVGWWLMRGSSPSGVTTTEAAGIITLPGSPAAVAVTKPSVAILHFHNLRGDDQLAWLRTGLTDMLVTDLSQHPAVRVVSAERIYKILDQLGQAETNGTMPLELVREAGRVAAADAVVTGNFVEVQGQLSITFKLYQMPDGELLATDRLVGDGEGSLFSLVDRLSRKVSAHLEAGEPGPVGRSLDTVTTASLEAYRYYVEGRNLRLQVKLTEALPLLEKAVELDPAFAMAWARLAVVYRALGRDADSRQAAKRGYVHAERLPPRERAFVSAQYFGASKETYPQAIIAYQQVLAVDPDDHTARYNLAAMLTYLERTDEAIAHLERLRASQTDITGPYFFLAHEYLVTGEYARGLEVLRSAASQQPDLWWRHNTLGWHLAMGGDFDDADRALARAEELRPGDSFLTVHRWHSAVLREDWAAAEAAALAGRQTTDPYGQSNGVLHAAILRLFRGKPDEALELVAELSDINPNDERFAARGHACAAEILLQIARPAEALDMALEAQREAPDDWQGWRAGFLIAQAHQALGNPDAADRAVAAIDPSLSPVDRRYHHHAAGRLALARGQVAEARLQLDDAVALLLPRGISWKLVPDHVPVWTSAAEAAEADGDQLAAIDWYRNIANSTTEHVEQPVPYVRSFYHLGRLYADSGDRQRAVESFRRFLDFWRDGAIDRERIEEARRFIDSQAG